MRGIVKGVPHVVANDHVVQQFSLAELYMAEIPAVLGVHAGPGALGLAFYKED
jgi:fatty acid-binding protein DegV